LRGLQELVHIRRVFRWCGTLFLCAKRRARSGESQEEKQHGSLSE
jgi:hypothetical protein